MKSKYWIILLGAVFLLCLGLCIPLLAGAPQHTAVITSNGEVVATLDLRIDRQLVVDTPDGGSNTVTVSGGKIAVTSATCPDHHCMHRGFCNSGAAIVCLPNKLVIEFSDASELDAALG